MSTASLEPSTADPGGISSGEPPPTARRQPSTGDRLYRIVWRWHFYAGMIIVPVLIVVAATGVLYIFKDEIEGLLHPGVVYIEPSAERVSYDQQLAAARAAVPANYRIGLMQVFANPKRATTLAMAGDKFQYSYVDQYRGNYLGSIEKGGFADIVLDLHRTLFLGTTGRIVVELTTCWTIVLAATGIYLWWPRRATQVWGVWLPRLRRKPYVVLRDLHTVSGIYVAVIAIVIALTGLIYTFVWGYGFQYAGRKTDAYDMFSKPMLSKSPADAPHIAMDRIVEIAQQRLPDHNLTIWFPRATGAVYLVTANNERGPQVNDLLFIDHGTGEILEDRPISQTKTVYWLGVWNFALHVGSVWGLPTKIFWFATCVVLTTAPLTGIWMWWERRPKGRLGLPRRVDARRPLWLVVTIIATSLLLPALGASVLAVIIVDQVAVRVRKR